MSSSELARLAGGVFGGFVHVVTYMDSARWPSDRAALWLALGWDVRGLEPMVEILVFSTSAGSVEYSGKWPRKK